MSCVSIGRFRYVESCEAFPFSKPDATESKRRRLVTMARSPKSKVRAAAAGNPNTPAWVLEELADDPDVEVRRWVARNQATDPLLLKIMGGIDPDPGIRAFAKNRSSV
jgi:hypothetical protein